MKHALILHEGTSFFLGRIPFWQGKEIEGDAFGQRVNGVINVDYTTDSQYPVWSPIDFQHYQECRQDPDNEENRGLVAGRIVALLHTIRQNFVQPGGNRFDDADNIAVVKHALPMLELIVTSSMR